MIRFVCNKCGKIYEIDDSNLDYNCVYSDHGRQMGAEHGYLGSVELKCDGILNSNLCENDILIEFRFWEYPANIFNYSEYGEEGCVVLEEPNYQLYLVEEL